MIKNIKTFRKKETCDIVKMGKEEYYLISIGTALKGDIYTLVSKDEKPYDTVKVEWELSMLSKDEPLSPFNTISSAITCTKEDLSLLYSIYPTIKQIIYCNDFLQKHSLSNFCMSINYINIDANNHKKDPACSFRIDESHSDKYIDKAFEVCHMKSKDITLGKIEDILLEEEEGCGIWEFPSEEENFELWTGEVEKDALVFLKKSPVIYKIPMKDLVSLQFVSVDVFVNYIDRAGISKSEIYRMGDINSILEGCQYIPQIYMFNKALGFAVVVKIEIMMNGICSEVIINRNIDRYCMLQLIVNMMNSIKFSFNITKEPLYEEITTKFSFSKNRGTVGYSLFLEDDEEESDDDE